MFRADDALLWCSASRSWVELPGELASDEPPPAELAAACACSSCSLKSLTRYSRFRSLSMTFPTPVSASWGARAFDAVVSLVRRLRSRAHLGGRSVEGKTQAIFARRHLEHGDCLSQRTLRVRHMTQLRNFDAFAGADDGVVADADEFAFFSEPKAEGSALALVLSGNMLQSGNWHYDSGRLMTILSSPLKPASYCEEADARLFPFRCLFAVYYSYSSAAEVGIASNSGFLTKRSLPRT